MGRKTIYRVEFKSKNPEDIAKMLSLIHLFQADNEELENIDLATTIQAIDWTLDRLESYFRICKEIGLDEDVSQERQERTRQNFKSAVDRAFDRLKG